MMADIAANEYLEYGECYCYLNQLQFCFIVVLQNIHTTNTEAIYEDLRQLRTNRRYIYV